MDHPFVSGLYRGTISLTSGKNAKSLVWTFFPKDLKFIFLLSLYVCGYDYCSWKTSVWCFFGFWTQSLKLTLTLFTVALYAFCWNSEILLHVLIPCLLQLQFPGLKDNINGPWRKDPFLPKYCLHKSGLFHLCFPSFSAIHNRFASILTLSSAPWLLFRDYLIFAYLWLLD